MGRRSYQGQIYGTHSEGGRVPQATIDAEVLALREYVQSPRTVYEMAKRFACSGRTILRRLALIPDIWRVTKQDHRTCHYVQAPQWAEVQEP